MNDSMSVDVAAIRAALAKATPATWAHDGDGWVYRVEDEGGSRSDMFVADLSEDAQAGPQGIPNADLICLLRNQAEALLDSWAESLNVMDRVYAEAERRGAAAQVEQIAAVRALHDSIGCEFVEYPRWTCRRALKYERDWCPKCRLAHALGVSE